MNSTHTITSRVVLTTLIASLIGTLFIAIPQFSRASENGSTDESTTASTKKVKKVKVDAVCMQTAIDTREDAIISSWDKFASSMKDALKVRKTALHAAWGLSDVKAQNKAVASAWKEYKKSSQEAHKALKSARKSAWDAFKKTTKTSCKVSTPKDEALSTDSAGSISL
jgi:DNA repair ATPase RecN